MNLHKPENQNSEIMHIIEGCRTNIPLTQIFGINDMHELRGYLSELSDVDMARTCLLNCFKRLSVTYCNANEWNMAVRLCECLAIIGWGDCEPLEAVRSVWVNGNPETFFINRHGESFFLDAVWSKRKDGVAIDFERSCFHKCPDTFDIDNHMAIGETQNLQLCSQQNWIPKNPICITRGIANCYENSKTVIESIDNCLMPALNNRMRPELYGCAINQIILSCSFSFYDNYHCKTNYIIADDSLKLKQKDFHIALLNMFPEQEIEDNGYYLRKRFTYGPFNSRTGNATVRIVFEKEFSEISPKKQRQQLSEYFIQAIEHIAKRLCRKVDYDFELMTQDFYAILKEWREIKI